MTKQTLHDLNNKPVLDDKQIHQLKSNWYYGSSELFNIVITVIQ